MCISKTLTVYAKCTVYINFDSISMDLVYTKVNINSTHVNYNSTSTMLDISFAKIISVATCINTQCVLQTSLLMREP